MTEQEQDSSFLSRIGRKEALIGVAALFLLGGGTATVIDYFASSSGDVETQQAIKIDGETGEANLSVFDTEYDEVVASETTYSTASIANYQNRSYTLEYVSDLETQSEEEINSSVTDYQIVWNDGSSDEGVRTTYANYFADAGASDVSAQFSEGDEDVEVSDEQALRNEVQNSATEVIQLTSDVSLTEQVKINQDTVIFGDGDIKLNGHFIHLDGQKPGASEVDVVLEGLNVSNDAETSMSSENADIVVQRLDQASLETVDLTLRNNEFTTPNKVVSTYREGLNGGDYVFEGNTVTVEAEDPNSWAALHIDQHEGDITIRDNEFDTSYNAITFGKTFEQATIENNEFTGKRGINFGHTTEGTANYEANVTGNLFTGIEEEAIRVEDQAQYGLTNGNIQTISISENRFSDNNVDIENSHSEDVSLSATHNFFAQGTWEEADNSNFQGDVDASYETLEQMPAAEDRSTNTPSEMTLAIVNEFDTHLSGSEDYTLTTRIR